MGRPQEVVGARLAARATAALRRISDAGGCIRLQAIASCARYPLSVVAAVSGVSRRAVWQWAKRFKEEGIEGLRDRPRGHRPSKLSAEQLSEVDRWLAEARDQRGEPVHWTLAELQEAVLERFGVRTGMTALWKRVRARGFRQKVPRPRHRQAGPEQQEAFKKDP